MAFSSQSSFRGQVLDEQDAEDKFSCGICCNLMENPCRPNVCQHLFCKECLYNSSIQSNQCPMCRKCFSFSKVVFDKQIENEMSNTAIKCEYCRQIVKVRNLANHRTKCNEYVTPKKSQNGSFSSTSSASAASWDSGNGSLSNPPRQSAVSQLRSMVSNIVASHSSRPAAPNRYTFRCPYCHADNLTLDSLRDHCNQYHVDGEKEMVCPVCTAMPWGDPNYKSIDFITHLNFRHKFEYDKYVDFSLEDEDALAQALRNSLMVK